MAQNDDYLQKKEDWKKTFSLPGERWHTVYRYRDDMFKVVQLYRDTPAWHGGCKRTEKKNDHKLSNNLSRERRMLLEYAMCNHWDYFVTLTLDESKSDRFNLDAWMRRFNQFIRDERKKGLVCRYIIVPERHEDGAWHAHGLFAGNMELEYFWALAAKGEKLPAKLVNSDYMRWKLYHDKFGYCSFGRIKNPVASAFYITKYITKDLLRTNNSYYGHGYYNSRPLATSSRFAQFVDRCEFWDSHLANKYEFCATGMIYPKENWNSELLSMAIEEAYSPAALFSSIPARSSASSDAELEADSWYDFEQLHFI